MKEMLMSKKNIVILAAALLACLMVGGATLALLTSASGTMTNSFSVSEISTIIEEEIDDNMGKKPTVKNTGSADCLVRVKVTVNPSDILYDKTSNPTGKISLDYNTEEELNSNEAKDSNGTSWKLGDDGYWYYQGVLEAGQTTDTALFTQVTWLPTNADGSLDLSDFEEFDIILYQEAIQTHAGNEANAIVNGEYNDNAAKKVWEIYDSTKSETATGSTDSNN